MTGEEMLFARTLARAAQRPRDRFCSFYRSGERQDITNGDLLEWIAAFAGTFATLPRGAAVVIMTGHHPQVYAAFIAAVVMGVVPSILPLCGPKQDPKVFRHGLDNLMRRLRPAVALCAGDAKSTLAGLEGATRIVDIDSVQRGAGADISRFQERLHAPEFHADATCFLQHSSGTTALKKGVELTHRQVVGHVDAYAAALQMTDRHVVASWLPLYHDMGLIASFILPAMLGCEIVSLDAHEWVVRPGMLLDAIEAHAATHCWMPNFAFHHIVGGDAPSRSRDLRSVEALISCSEPCRADAFDRFHERYSADGLRVGALQTCYAMAETVFAVTQSRFDDYRVQGTAPGTPYLSSGRPIRGVQVRVTSAAADGAGTVRPGALQVRSESLFKGYHANQPPADDRVSDGWYDTGDLGFMHDRGLFVVGRLDDLVILNGRNIVAHEVEDALNLVPHVIPGRILVYGAYDERVGTTRLNVAVESDATDPPALTALTRGVRQAVVDHTGMAAAKVRIVPKGFLLKSTSGKIARAASVRKLADEVHA